MNWLRDYLPSKALVLDASALINILGCGATEDVFKSLRRPCVVEEKVLAEITRHPVPGLSHVKAMDALIKSRCIEVSIMNAEEYKLFISMVQAPLPKRLGSGESAALAVASLRDLPIILDDNKARAARTATLPGVEAISSLKLFVSASVRLGRDKLFLRDVLHNALTVARMGVPKDERTLLRKILSDLG